MEQETGRRGLPKTVIIRAPGNNRPAPAGMNHGSGNMRRTASHNDHPAPAGINRPAPAGINRPIRRQPAAPGLPGVRGSTPANETDHGDPRGPRLRSELHVSGADLPQAARPVAPVGWLPETCNRQRTWGPIRYMMYLMGPQGRSYLRVFGADLPRNPKKRKSAPGGAPRPIADPVIAAWNADGRHLRRPRPSNYTAGPARAESVSEDDRRRTDRGDRPVAGFFGGPTPRGGDPPAARISLAKSAKWPIRPRLGTTSRRPAAVNENPGCSTSGIDPAETTCSRTPRGCGDPALTAGERIASPKAPPNTRGWTGS